MSRKTFDTILHKYLSHTHTAEDITGLSSQGSSIANGGTVTGNLVLTGGFKITFGAVADYVLTSDSAGNATWRAVTAASSIDDGSITYAKIQNVSATDRLLGRATAGSGVVEEITCTAAGRALLDDADASAQRTTLGLGTASTHAHGDYDPAGSAAAAQAASQPLDADLTAFAALVSAADKLPYATGSGTWALTSFTGFMRTLLDDADAATARATLGAGTSNFDGVYSSLSGIPSTFVPSAHASNHVSGGSDPIKLDDLATPDDNTDLDVSTVRHGLVPKAPNNTTMFLRGDGTWATLTVITEAQVIGRMIGLGF